MPLTIKNTYEIGEWYETGPPVMDSRPIPTIDRYEINPGILRQIIIFIMYQIDWYKAVNCDGSTEIPPSMVLIYRYWAGEKEKLEYIQNMKNGFWEREPENGNAWQIVIQGNDDKAWQAAISFCWHYDQKHFWHKSSYRMPWSMKKYLSSHPNPSNEDERDEPQNTQAASSNTQNPTSGPTWF